MKKPYATIYDFKEEGEAGLVSILRECGFEVESKSLALRIYYSLKSRIEVGHVDTLFHRCHLHVLNIRNNPLQKFVKRYGSSSNEPTPNRFIAKRK